MSTIKTSLWLSLIILLSCYRIATGAVLHLDGTQDRIDLQEHLEWFAGDKAEMDIIDLLANEGRFEKAPKRNSYSRSPYPYWFHLRLLPHDPLEKQRLLELAYTQIDRLEYYSRVGKGPWRQVSTGDKRPFASRDIRHPHPVFRVPLQPGVVTEIVLRVQSNTSIMVPLTLWREDAFASYNQDLLLINGISYGVLLALVFYNLFLYPTVRDPAYLWFALYLGSFALFQFSLDGLSARYLWPQWPEVADRAVTLSLWICMAAGLKFTQHIGHTRRYSPKFDRLFGGLSLFALLMAGVVALRGPGTVFPLLPPFGLLVVLLIPVPLWIAWRNGYLPARFALLAYLPVVPGALLIAARTLNRVEPSFWSEHLFIIGAALSSILLSFALADRINIMRTRQAVTQAKLLESERAASRAQQKFSRQLLEAQDNERRRIAADLHDSVGQNLSFLHNMLKRFQRQKKVALPAAINEAAQNAIEEVRTISHHLHPPLLDKIGVIAAIEALTEQTAIQTGIQADISLDDVTDLLPAGADLHLYRVTQEALNNIIQHSKADRIELSLQQKGGNIEFSIADNGQGMDSRCTNSGLGLESITERAKLLGGNVVFEAVMPHGFKLILSIPIAKKS